VTPLLDGHAYRGGTGNTLHLEIAPRARLLGQGPRPNQGEHGEEQGLAGMLFALGRNGKGLRIAQLRSGSLGKFFIGHFHGASNRKMSRFRGKSMN